LNEQLKFLIELQDVDSAVISAAEKIELLPQKLELFKAPLKESNELFQKARTGYDALSKKKKDKDLQLDEMQDKINKLKSRSSDIKTNKEYEAHLKEIEGFEKKMSAIEDDILVTMEEIEIFEKELKKEDLKVKKAEDELKEQERIIGDEQKKLQAELEKEKAKKDEIASKINKEIYIQYTNLLDRYGDKAVVETRNEICLGCNTNIPPQLFNDIRKNEDLFNCFYCKRFLYYKELPLNDKQDQEAAPTP
jgi:predicted  nucleic acid-binding Zn-ribbon protein